MDLNTLLSGIDSQLFFRKFWEKAPYLLNTNEVNRFASLLTLKELDLLLSERNFRTDECKVATAGKVISDSLYLTKPTLKVMEKSIDDLVDNNKLLELFSQGATLVFNQFSRQQPIIQSLKKNIENQLNATVLTNLFLSPPHSQGFSAHYDSHDVILLQLHGKKHWKVYESPIKLPLKSQAFGHQRSPSTKGMAQAIDQTLSTGDLLYIPRGFMHEALTSDETSLHLTLGIHRISKLDLLKDLLEQYALGSAQLRYALPIDFESWPQQEQLLAIKDWFQQSLESITREQLSLTLQKEQRRIESEAPESRDNLLNNICQSFALDDDFCLEIIDQNALGIAQHKDQSILYYRNSKVISLTTTIISGFDFLTAKDHISSNDFPGNLSLSDKKSLAKTLITAGIAKPISESASQSFVC
ncbi:MAG: cupin domain-containing protein [Pseudomonadales bacterium]|nr:cupin domain-containing protein [Pseudomonadales bacterium]